MKGCKRSPVEIESYRKLVAMMAWRAYSNLPMQVRSWIGIEDMVEDGMQFAWQMSFKYNRKVAGFSTFLYHQLHRFFINDYLEWYSAQQRGWTRINGVLKPMPHISLQAMQEKLRDKERRTEFDDVVAQIPALVTSPDHIYNNALTECFVVPALSSIYKLASPKLQEQMVVWFWSTNERNCSKGKRFKKLAGEFRELCEIQCVSCEDCLHLMRSPSCLDSLSRSIFEVPYDLDNPCPASMRLL